MRRLGASDPHGDHSQVLAYGPQADVIFPTGDLEPQDYPRTIPGPLADKTWRIPGNHDAKKPGRLARLESMRKQCQQREVAQIGDLARYMGVRLVVRGHHHERYEAWIECGIKVLGVGTPDAMDPATHLDAGMKWLEDMYQWKVG